jgi:hypothetical protein
MDGWVWSDGGMILTGGTEVLGEKHYTAWVVDGWMGMERWWDGTDRGNWSAGIETFSNATLSTTNSIWIGLTIILSAPQSESIAWLHESCNRLFNSLTPILVSPWIFKWQNKRNCKGEAFEVVQEIVSLLKPSLFFLFRFLQTSAQMKQLTSKWLRAYSRQRVYLTFIINSAFKVSKF